MTTNDELAVSVVRDEDAFDVAAVHSWLQTEVALPPSLPMVRQFTGGSSNLTYLLRYQAGGPELILRRPPQGAKAAGAHDMDREYRVQRGLRPVFPYVPQMIGFCADTTVIGSPFYVMERVPGRILRGADRGDLLLPPEQTRRLAQRVFDILAMLHEVDVDVAGLTDLSRGPGYVRRQVEGWARRYRAARTENVPDFGVVMDWLSANQPPDTRLCLIHNDFRLDNVILDEQNDVSAVLDWEMATVGDPLMDLGSALAYWVQADDDEMYRISRRQPSDVSGMPTRTEIVDRYRAQTGIALDNWSFYEVFGLFRLAVICQQIYLRYHLGQTTNPAFKDFWIFVTYLDERCRRLARIT
jgi:aminoglycoside phosphotransferase (APT) family kinase protein